MKTLTATRLKELLNYDEKTGIFTRKVRTSNRINIGDIAGTKCKKGYIVIRVEGNMLKAARLAWLYMTGEWPKDIIDHKNGIRDDNRFENLREATNYINAQNIHGSRIDSETRILGASPTSNGYRAQISCLGKTKYLGYFKTPELAHQAYLSAKRELHEGCTI